MYLSYLSIYLNYSQIFLLLLSQQWHSWNSLIHSLHYIIHCTLMNYCCPLFSQLKESFLKYNIYLLTKWPARLCLNKMVWFILLLGCMMLTYTMKGCWYVFSNVIKYIKTVRVSISRISISSRLGLTPHPQSIRDHLLK